uniref:Uncharacterized protein n=1 Tax=Bactrocera latifrons TaxID=174628 RepID=A0A0K8VM00_BACLA
MSKFGLMLLLLGTTMVLWQQAEAKPLFLLSKNFFTLRTRAPSTGSGYSYSPSSLASGGLAQLPVGIISSKLGLISSLLSTFGGGSGGGGGGFGLGFKSNVAATTRRPKKTSKSTTEPNTVFTPETSTKAYTTTSTTTTAAPEEPVSTTTVATIDVNPTVIAQRPAAIEPTDVSESVAGSNVNSGFEVIYDNTNNGDQSGGLALTNAEGTSNAFSTDGASGVNTASSSGSNGGYEVIYSNSGTNGSEASAGVGGSSGFGGSGGFGLSGAVEGAVGGVEVSTNGASGVNAASSSGSNGGYEVIYSNSGTEGSKASAGAGSSAGSSGGSSGGFGFSGAVGGSSGFGISGAVGGANAFGISGGVGSSSAAGSANLSAGGLTNSGLTSARPSINGYNYNKPEDTSVNEIFGGNLSNTYVPVYRYR